MTGTTRRLLAGPDKFDPKSIGNLAAAYDFTQPSTTTSDKLRASAGGSISLCADTSGNSNVNVLANATASPALTASLPTGVTVTTGQFTVSARFFVPAAAPASSMGLPPYLGPGSTGSVGADSLVCVLETTGKLSIQKRSAANGAQHVWLNIADFQATYGNGWHTLTIRRGAAAWALFVDGVAFGGASVAYLAENVDSTYLHVVPRSSENYSGSVAWSRMYSTGLSDAEVLADALGAVQANNVVDCDFSIAAKFAASFACGTGQTVTITGAGAQGARICGARDVVNLVAASMPTLLPWSGVNYGYLNGVAGNYFSTPDSAAVSVTGDIDLIAKLNLKAWTTGAVSQDIIAKWETGNQAYLFRVNSDGKLRLITTADGSTAVSAQSTTAVSFSALTDGWIRATRDVDNGASGNTTTFYTSTDSVSWTPLGTAVVNAGTTSIHDGNAVLRLSGNALASDTGISGGVFRAKIYNGINGTLVADFDPTRYVSGTTLSSATGETWTLNGGATIVTGQCAYFDGVDDFVKSAAFPLAQPVTVILAGLNQVTWTSTDVLADGIVPSVQIAQVTASPQMGIPGGAIATGLLAVKTSGILSAIWSATSSLIRIGRLAAVTGTGPSTAPNGFTLGANGTPGQWSNITVQKVLVYNAALSIETINRIVAALARELRIPLT